MGWLNVPSHEWIYQHIYRDKQAGGALHTYLRNQKTYRKRGLAGNERRGQIPHKTSIHLRPAEIEQRGRVGDIEGDTIIPDFPLAIISNGKSGINRTTIPLKLTGILLPQV